MKRRIAISAGHSNTPGQDQGAISKTIIEGVETVNLRNLIVEEFKQRKEPINIDPDSNVTFKTVALFRQYFAEPDILLDIHFNSAINTSASGTEVLIPAQYDDFEYKLAYDLSYAVARVLAIPNRGVKTELDSARKKLMWMSIPGKNILLEVCFISNYSDATLYLEYKREVAKAITNVLLTYKYK